MGVFLPVSCFRSSLDGLPHARGGVSVCTRLYKRVGVSSPRAWGCFYLVAGVCTRYRVFPTRVGVFPARQCHPQSRTGLPHARGGVSRGFCRLPHWNRSSPRAWGCFRLGRRRSQGGAVFPTRVGVFLSLFTPDILACSLPHARGGVSSCAQASSGERPSSPRAWGCFHLLLNGIRAQGVFPTRVGVFLSCVYRSNKKKEVFPTRVGVFPRSVSSSWVATPVFPTRVGVFLRKKHRTADRFSLPHARGGVSPACPPFERKKESSPRAWGCFHARE